MPVALLAAAAVGLLCDVFLRVVSRKQTVKRLTDGKDRSLIYSTGIFRRHYPRYEIAVHPCRACHADATTIYRSRLSMLQGLKILHETTDTWTTFLLCNIMLGQGSWLGIKDGSMLETSLEASLGSN